MEQTLRQEIAEIILQGMSLACETKDCPDVSCEICMVDRICTAIGKTAEGMPEECELDKSEIEGAIGHFDLSDYGWELAHLKLSNEKQVQKCQAYWKEQTK